MPIAIRCPSCGETWEAADDLVGKTVECPRCHATFQISMPFTAGEAEPAQAAPFTRTSSAPHGQAFPGATASMILGIASWFIFRPILGAAAIIMGAMTLHGIRKRQPEQVAGKGRAIAGICFGSVGVLITVVLLITLPIAREKARRAYCGNNLRQIGLALASYSLDYSGYYPATLDDLVQAHYLEDPKVFLCPSRGSYEADAKLAEEKLKEMRLAGRPGTTEATLPLHYVYIPYKTAHYMGGKGLSIEMLPIIFDQKDNHGGKGRNIFYSDLHCSWLEETSLRAEFEAAAANNPAFKKYLEEHAADVGR